MNSIHWKSADANLKICFMLYVLYPHKDLLFKKLCYRHIAWMACACVWPIAIVYCFQCNTDECMCVLVTGVCTFGGILSKTKNICVYQIRNLVSAHCTHVDKISWSTRLSHKTYFLYFGYYQNSQMVLF